MRTYNVRLEFWFLPLIETTRDGYFPMEVAYLIPNQRYQYKMVSFPFSPVENE